MTQNIAYNSEDDSCSNVTVESEEIDAECSVVKTKFTDDLIGSQILASNLNLPGIPDKLPISHISSVALQNSTDITFGNKTLYSGPITVNQYGIEKPTTTNFGKNIVFFKRWKITLTVTAIIVFAIASISIIIALYFQNGDADNDYNDNGELRLVTREEWRAKPATGVLPDLKTPVSLVVIQHTVQSSCDSLETCATLVRQIQSQHINSASIEDDIGYNFLVGGDGAAYEGRGWNKIGAHTYGYNSRSIGVAFIGDFRNEEPTKQQVVALRKLLRDGVNMNKISENYSLIGANQVQQTESPGKMLYKILTKLPHWSDQIE